MFKTQKSRWIPYKRETLVEGDRPYSGRLRLLHSGISKATVWFYTWGTSRDLKESCSLFILPLYTTAVKPSEMKSFMEIISPTSLGYLSKSKTYQRVRPKGWFKAQLTINSLKQYKLIISYFLWLQSPGTTARSTALRSQQYTIQVLAGAVVSFRVWPGRYLLPRSFVF